MSEPQPPTSADVVGDEVPEVRYIPGAPNQYDYEYDVIILDENLKEYPQAHDQILEHELQHSKPECQTLSGFLRHEYQTDREFYFRDDEVMDEIREYYQDRDEPQLGLRMRLVLATGNLIRDLWRPFMRLRAGFDMYLSKLLLLLLALIYGVRKDDPEVGKEDPEPTITINSGWDCETITDDDWNPDINKPSESE